MKQNQLVMHIYVYMYACVYCIYVWQMLVTCFCMQRFVQTSGRIDCGSNVLNASRYHCLKNQSLGDRIVSVRSIYKW